MKDFDEDTEDAKLLRKDLEELKRRFGGDGKIHMELNFSSKYPIEPVFIRVVSPRMLQYTGNVTIGGAVCSEFSVEKYQPDWKISEIMRMVRLNMLTAPKVYVKTQFGPGGRAGPLRVDLNGTLIVLIILFKVPPLHCSMKALELFFEVMWLPTIPFSMGIPQPVGINQPHRLENPGLGMNYTNRITSFVQGWLLQSFSVPWSPP